MPRPVAPGCYALPQATTWGVLGVSAVYRISATNGVTVNPDPVSDTLVDSLTLLVPLPVTSYVLVMAQVDKNGAHPDKYAVYDGTTKLTGGINIYDYITADSEYFVSIIGSYLLSAGLHTINIKANAVASTASVQFKERHLIVQVLR